MSGKSVEIKTRSALRAAQQAANPDDWVQNRAPVPAQEPEKAREPISRLTLDLPESLHRRIKVSCAARGIKMAEELREILEQRYPSGGEH